MVRVLSRVAEEEAIANAKEALELMVRAVATLHRSVKRAAYTGRFCKLLIPNDLDFLNFFCKESLWIAKEPMLR